MNECEGAGLGWAVEMVKRHSMMEAIFVPAFVDLDTLPRQVKLFPRSVFVESTRGLMAMNIDEKSGQIRLADSDALVTPPALSAEPSLEPVFADLSINYLSEIAPLRCLAVVLHLDVDSSGPENRFRAVELHFAGDRILLFDPFWPSGIKIGGKFEAVRLRKEIAGGHIIEVKI
ncbi:hypothetical protein [Micromonospora wenchangensis]|uniref:hypothetical protein n=1 Tax=Micromonospora wenchangensis TaxID=1185415 RepID=UPI0011841CB4|nr:hypothetical protein [Micromonospora wenchangensis]